MSDGSLNIPSPPHSPYAPIPSPPPSPYNQPTNPLARVRQFGRNLNQGQFGGSRAMQGLGRVLDVTQRAQAFRHAGMGAAVRYTLGMPQLTPDAESAYRARLYRTYGGQPGRNPGALYPHGERDDVDGDEVGGGY